MLRKAFSKLRKGLTKTRESFAGALRAVAGGRSLDDDLLRELKRRLVEADMGVETSLRLVDAMRDAAKRGEIKTGDEAVAFLKSRVLETLRSGEDNAAVGPRARASSETPYVVLVVGVNGVGKTTTIAKLANRYQQEQLRVVLGACDTFRAGAVRQLEIWAQRLGVEIIRGKEGGDPDAVAFDACDAAVARGADVLILDTAGRLHTQEPLMRQLRKIRDVATKRIASAPHETLLILDASTGQNAVRQAEQFTGAVDVSGLILTKLDGTARGGVVVAIRDAIGLPVRFIGVGETIDDLAPFDAEAFVDALFEAESPAAKPASRQEPIRN